MEIGVGVTQSLSSLTRWFSLHGGPNPSKLFLPRQSSLELGLLNGSWRTWTSLERWIEREAYPTPHPSRISAWEQWPWEESVWPGAYTATGLMLGAQLAGLFLPVGLSLDPLSRGSLYFGDSLRRSTFAIFYLLAASQQVQPTQCLGGSVG